MILEIIREVVVSASLWMGLLIVCGIAGIAFVMSKKD